MASETSITPSPQRSTPATSARPSSNDALHTSASGKRYTPPLSTSDYSWQYLEYAAGEGEKRCWWRNVDAMANFILHWQTRFHEHGDMYFSCLLMLESQAQTQMIDVSVLQVREAVRRLRITHPTMALRLAKRSEFGIEPLVFSSFAAKHVDLQVALVYDVVRSEAEVQDWLDTALVVHSEPRQVYPAEADLQQHEFLQHVAASTAHGVLARDRLVVHFWPADIGRGIPARIALDQNHSVSDGVGSLMLFDELLRSLASVLKDATPLDVDWGSEVTRLEPSLQDAIANPPASWSVSAQELKVVKQVNADRMSGKAGALNLVDKIGGKLMAAAMRGNQLHRSALRRKVLNKPIVALCRSVAEKGEMLPLGLLPQTGKPYTGDIGHTGMFINQLTADQTKRLLAALKKQNQTLAPFLEACMHMATTWTRKHRGLTPQGRSSRKRNGFDNPNRILGSFSNTVNKRGTLVPQYGRYLGLCMSGIPTKIGASKAQWSPESEPVGNTHEDVMPVITRADLQTLMAITTDIAHQYRSVRDNPNWLRYDTALMFDTMETEYLFLRDDAHYPSMPWLSSIGKTENFVAGSYPVDSAYALAADNFRVAGRNELRQPQLHVYTYKMQTILQVAYATWLYDEPNSQGQQTYFKKDKAARENIMRYWYRVVEALIFQVIEDGEKQA